jgi:hypothetical protein
VVKNRADFLFADEGARDLGSRAVRRGALSLPTISLRTTCNPSLALPFLRSINTSKIPGMQSYLFSLPAKKGGKRTPDSTN